MTDNDICLFEKEGCDNSSASVSELLPGAANEKKSKAMSFDDEDEIAVIDISSIPWMASNISDGAAAGGGEGSVLAGLLKASQDTFAKNLTVNQCMKTLLSSG